MNTKIIEVDNKIPNHDKHVTTPEFIKLTAENFTARVKQANLETKIDFDNKITSFNVKIISNKTKYLEVQKELNSLITNYYNFFLGVLQVMADLKTHLFIDQHLIRYN